MPTPATEPHYNLIAYDELYKAIVMYERSNLCFKQHQLETLPLLSPPPYQPLGPNARLSTTHTRRPDDYQCTISNQNHDITVINISIHIHQHLDTDRIPCWRVRRKLIALDQPICIHRCTSDPAFFRTVRRRMNTLCISFSSREYLPFFGRWADRSRTWRCKEEGCNMSAWITEDRDTGNLRLHARTQWAGELKEHDAELLEAVKVRAEEGGGLRYE